MELPLHGIVDGDDRHVQCLDIGIDCTVIGSLIFIQVAQLDYEERRIAVLRIAGDSLLIGTDCSFRFMALILISIIEDRIQ